MKLKYEVFVIGKAEQQLGIVDFFVHKKFQDINLRDDHVYAYFTIEKQGDGYVLSNFKSSGWISYIQDFPSERAHIYLSKDVVYEPIKELLLDRYDELFEIFEKKLRWNYFRMICHGVVIFIAFLLILLLLGYIAMIFIPRK